MNLIYRVRDNVENKYADSDLFSILANGDLMIFAGYEWFEVNDLQKYENRYSIEYGIEIDGKKFFECDVIYHKELNNRYTIVSLSDLFNDCFILSGCIVGTIHDEEFKYLKEFV